MNTLGRQVVWNRKNSCENLCSFLLTLLNTSPTGMYELFHIYSRGAKISFLNIIHAKLKDLGLPHTVTILTLMVRRCLPHGLSVYYVQSLLQVHLSLYYTNLSHGGKTSWKSFYPTPPWAIPFCIFHRILLPSFVVLIRLCHNRDQQHNLRLKMNVVFTQIRVSGKKQNWIMIGDLSGRTWIYVLK